MKKKPFDYRTMPYLFMARLDVRDLLSGDLLLQFDLGVFYKTSHIECLRRMLAASNSQYRFSVVITEIPNPKYNKLDYSIDYRIFDKNLIY